MSKVNLDDVTYPYFVLSLEDDEAAEKVGINLSRLYLYIDEYKNMGSIYKYGNAYRAIKIRANELYGRKKSKISKRQVASLRKYYTVLRYKRHIKIPYSLHYIFRAVFEIVDELKKDHPLPDDLECFIGRIRRDIFYHEQSDIFDDWYNYARQTGGLHDEWYKRGELIRGLYDDMFAGNAVLSKKF